MGWLGSLSVGALVRRRENEKTGKPDLTDRRDTEIAEESNGSFVLYRREQRSLFPTTVAT